MLSSPSSLVLHCHSHHRSLLATGTGLFPMSHPVSLLVLRMVAVCLSPTPSQRTAGPCV